MIRVIHARNVNEAYGHGLLWLANRGHAEPSRDGDVIVAPDPVITHYTQPRERVLFSPQRDANPFFHFMEGLWMLAGRNDVEWPTQFNSTFGQFSDDGKIFHGAYGYRWREYFGYDQLEVIIDELKANPASRRCVLTMWDAQSDEERREGADKLMYITGGDLFTAVEGGKDVPCNTNVFFRIQNGRLDMMVNCRSNDVIWGAYGANAVHMSMLQEYVARSVNVSVGIYTQSSFNFHAYTDRFPLEHFPLMAHEANEHDYYSQNKVAPYPLMQSERKVWDEDLQNFMMLAHPKNDPIDNYAKVGMFTDPIFAGVAMPMLCAWVAHKRKNYRQALHFVQDVVALDWQLAAKMWLERRADKHRQKEAGIA